MITYEINFHFSVFKSLTRKISQIPLKETLSK